MAVMAVRDFPGQADLDGQPWSHGGHTSYAVSGAQQGSCLSTHTHIHAPMRLHACTKACLNAHTNTHTHRGQADGQTDG